MTQAIRARVSEKTITKVTRLFNGSLSDILTELLQNARRAQATAVAVTWGRDPAHPDDSNKIRISVHDDGRGISDPQSILSMGESDWTAPFSGEDPAGMGFFSLAGRDVTITSRSLAGRAWSARINPHDWTGDTDIPVTQAIAPNGTTIQFTFDLKGSNHVHQALAAAARYYPLPVTLNGEPLDRADWTANAIHKAQWRGSTIAVIKNRPEYHSETLNFFGLTIKTPLPDLHDTRRTRYSVIVDIAPNSGLALVLPARKEIVQNAAYEELKTAAQLAIFEAIASLGAHHLTYSDWLAASELGIELPEASPMLTAWTPETGEPGNRKDAQRISTQSAFLIPDLEPLEAQCLARAIDLNRDDDTPELRLACDEPRYTGYTWYDALPRLEQPLFEIDFGDRSITIDAGEPSNEEATSAEARAIRVILKTTNTATPQTIVLASDFAAYNDVYSSWLDNLVMFWTKTDALNPVDVAVLLEAALFTYNDDSDHDSYDTQLSEFQTEAIETAIRHMGTRANLLAHKILTKINDLRWSLADEETVTITLTKAGVDVSVTA